MPLDKDNPLDLADPSWGDVEPTILGDTEQLFDRLDFFLKKRGWKFSELFTRFDISRSGECDLKVIEDGLNCLLRGRTPEGFLYQSPSVIDSYLEGVDGPAASPEKKGACHHHRNQRLRRRRRSYY